MLQEILPVEIFGFLLVLVRIGALFGFAPAFGEQQIPPRIRIAAAVGVAGMVYGLVRADMPQIPSSPILLAALLILEFLIGLMIAMTARLILNALNVAGTIVAFQTSLAASQQFDPTQGQQSAIFASFFSVTGVALLFATDLHLLMLNAMVDSYSLFPVGQMPVLSGFAQAVLDVVADTFLLGVQISAPFIVFGVVFNIGLGLTARLMPQLPVFFVAMPLNIFMGFLILLIAFPAMMMWFLSAFEEQLAVFLT
ncbi:flagellar biosynthetic protein FliR [Iodidimonas gelatinilytica]|uniref:Flagellar biosynthetic protein FliR n=2 Tax=Iodidimonas TaxID=2066486 RepID=A0A5A7MQR6_9PROT|nr:MULTISPECIES: flagellar biosynthetic protein FliR [Iodidimonas]GEQ98392.1 flagellar biosynthetic protein FliR [Iodidimonas gelatinilytica]GER00417.1 flagellar biosynthetic protein FliR [Iodidimonas gelatinilytica]GER08635.1 flagellar biosynthetic protein FliR [Kordiimonadales bacterium JCM 17843]GGO15717.1 flagellar biosynthetic protein FliR [Iodidimonas muriae]